MTTRFPLLLELGNSTAKVATIDDAGNIAVRRFGSLQEAAMVIDDRPHVILEPPDGWSTLPTAKVVHRSEVLVRATSYYDQPNTLGVDRVLNLLGMIGDGIAISCGTAITVDAIRDGRMCFGAILPGLRCAIEGLVDRLPVLPDISLEEQVGFPARTTAMSMANGILLGTAIAVSGLADGLTELLFGMENPAVVLTGGDATVLAAHWSSDPPLTPRVDDALMFRGLARFAGVL